MTDRSNYGPVRRLSPSVSTDNRKPYSRTGLKGVLGTLDLNSGDTAVPTPSESPYYPFHAETPQLEAPTQNRTVPDRPRDIAGFPTYEQYQRIEGDYLSCLSERKQPKALISQALFDKILAVLQNGSEDRDSTAQFRFWVRKMFVLAYPQTSFNHNTSQTTEPVVLHDKRPVAIKEQLYEVLCYCHAVARHGGRDKTCATLRLNYSWVPKELTAKFVKACPTCTLKRSGNPDLLSQFGQTVSSSPYAPRPLRPVTVPLEPASLPVFPGGPNDSPPPAGLSFVIGSEGYDGGSRGGGTTSAGFSTCPSIFATPDLSVYPSPTLSAGSLGPTTPSPFLPSGLFGYPAVFDPGHGSFSSMAGWDTTSSPFSPRDLMYPEEFHAGISKQHEALGVPFLATRAHSGDCDNMGGDADANANVGPLPRIVGTPCSADMGNIDPMLLMEGAGYPSFALVGQPMRMVTDDGEGDMDPGAGDGSSGGDDNVGPYLHIHNLAGAPNEEPSPSSDSSSRVFQQHQLSLALGITTPTMDELASISGPAPAGQRQHRLQLSPPTYDASASSGTTTTTIMTRATTEGHSFSRDDAPNSFLSLPPASTSSNSPAQLSMPVPCSDNRLLTMMMFKFASPGTPTMPTASTTTTAAAVLGMVIEGEEEHEHEHEQEGEDLQQRLGLQHKEDPNANIFDNNTTMTETQAQAQTQMPPLVDDSEKTDTKCRYQQQSSRCQFQCQWDSPEAWLVQSDSVDGHDDVSVVAMV